MKGVSRLILTIVISLVYLSGQITETVLAQEQETFAGTIVNATPGNVPPNGLEVVLTYVTSSDLFGQISTKTDVNGYFHFDELPAMPLKMLMVETIYLGVPYAKRADPSTTSGPITIKVFEETSSSNVLKVIDNSVVVMGRGSSPNTINILEAVHLQNDSDLMYVSKPETADPMDMLRFSLPQNVDHLDVETELIGGHILQVDKGFALTTPIPPGKHNILFTYVAHYSGEDWEFVHSSPFGSEVFRFLVKEGFGQADDSAFSNLGLVKIGELNFNILEIDSVEPGEKLSLRIEGLPTPSLLEMISEILQSKTFQLGIIPLLASVTLLSLLIYGIRHRNRRQFQ
ncbi:hypothetical protein FIM02_01925 [SAR202 cluster bacterium AD-802-E10_MRT_200m]|nr:hypothetical protein [SAR202 cluster bacterium AD-802-E10_MRT_200m]